VADEKTAPSRGRAWAWRVVRLAVTALALAWVLSRVDLEEVGAAFLRVPWTAFAAAIALTYVNLGIGTLRWQILLHAYGAPHRPSFGALYRLNLIGFFYNVWLPGGVGGDVVRAIASRDAFGDSGATGAAAVVFVERVLGLVGLLLIVGITSLLRPIAGVESVPTWSAIGIAIGVVAIVLVAVGRAIAPRLGLLRAVGERLPRIERPLPLAIAIVLSLATHSLVAITGHTFVATLRPDVPLSTSFVMVPLAMATAYLPITAGGAGAREAVFQLLYGQVGVSFEDATAASLLLAATYYLCALVGGVLRLPADHRAPRGGTPPAGPSAPAADARQ
jgi:uncharacterized membrane protein YbhN (UPF0104 family)